MTHISTHPSQAAEQQSVKSLIDALAQYEGPPEKFLRVLLEVQCRLARADSAAILRRAPQRGNEILAAFPEIETEGAQPVWLAQAVELLPKLSGGGASQIVPIHSPNDLYGQTPNQSILLLPLRGKGDSLAVAVFLFVTREPAVIEQGKARLEMTSALLSLYEMRLTVQKHLSDKRRLREAIEVMVAMDEQTRFRACAMSMCNETAARWDCDRVSLGLVRGRYVRVEGLSHTEKFTRKMTLVQSIESAMEECADQDIEILYPAPPEASFVNRATGNLSIAHGPTMVLSLPLRRGNEVVGVLTVERPPDRPFEIEEVEALRLVADLCTARVLDLYEHDKWIGAQLASKTRRGLATVLTPQHTWIKAVAVLVVGFLLFAIFVQGNYRVESPFEFQTTTRQFIVAPFDGFIDEILVKPGDPVEAGTTVLATLKTEDLYYELSRLEADRQKFENEYRVAAREQDAAKREIARAEADRVQAQIEYVRHQIAKSRLVAPISGIVTQGDLEGQLGAPVQTGTELFEIAPIEALRAELAVPEGRIGDVIEAQRKLALEDSDARLTGTLAAQAFPGKYVAFEVESINPVAEVSEDRNVFKVRVRLTEIPDEMAGEAIMRPKMQGVAKIDIGKASYGWIWTRELVNWVRMKMWW